LTSAESNPTDVSRIFLVLEDVRSNRQQFLELTVARLADKNDGVRMAAARLLGRIGTAKDGSPLVALLNDADEPVALAAAKALGAIGGSREKLALRIWRSSSNPGAFKELAKEVKKAIDDIEEREKKATERP